MYIRTYIRMCIFCMYTIRVIYIHVCTCKLSCVFVSVFILNFLLYCTSSGHIVLCLSNSVGTRYYLCTVCICFSLASTE
jgi:hypothetical protein